MAEIRPATESEAEYVVERLKAVDMMWEDVDPARSFFHVALSENAIIGFVRFEPCAKGALLGSLYVEPEYRKARLGQALVEYIENETRRQAISQIFLFSTEAGGFFQRLGYVEVPVADTVQAIPDAPQVKWYVARPDLLAEEITFAKTL
jgi:N-acetylglutamate synthase-like GNAT family acetyltransferase